MLVCAARRCSFLTIKNSNEFGARDGIVGDEGGDASLCFYLFLDPSWFDTLCDNVVYGQFVRCVVTVQCSSGFEPEPASSKTTCLVSGKWSPIKCTGKVLINLLS